MACKLLKDVSGLAFGIVLLTMALPLAAQEPGQGRQQDGLSVTVPPPPARLPSTPPQDQQDGGQPAPDDGAAYRSQTNLPPSTAPQRQAPVTPLPLSTAPIDLNGPPLPEVEITRRPGEGRGTEE